MDSNDQGVQTAKRNILLSSFRNFLVNLLNLTSFSHKAGNENKTPNTQRYVTLQRSFNVTKNRPPGLSSMVDEQFKS